MAAFDTTRTAYGASGAFAGFSATFSRLVARLVDWNDARVTRKALSALTDRELEDIGLIRGDIDAFARTDIIR